MGVTLRRNIRRKNKKSKKHRGGGRENWIVKHSKSTGKIYYKHKTTGETSWTIPNDNGWEPRISKTTGKRYWANPTTGQTSWTLPGQVLAVHSKSCDDPSLSEKDIAFCKKHPANIANIGSSGTARNIKYEIRKKRINSGCGCKLVFKTNNQGVTEQVPICRENDDYKAGKNEQNINESECYKDLSNITGLNETDENV